MTHAELCEIAKKWLKRPNSQRGHGCHVALSECRSGWGGEMPDAIGFRTASSDVETVVVEAKTSRADFLADFKKPHRTDGEGMGLYRYYMCPEGLVKPEEVPERWGLLWVSSGGRVTALLGPAALSANSGTFMQFAAAWQHQRNTERETWLLVRVMARISDPDKMKNAINAAQREQARLVRICNQQAERIRTLERPRLSVQVDASQLGEIPQVIHRKVRDTTPSSN